MAHINVQIPDEMEDELQETIEASGRYLNTSEYVRDALRRRMEEQPRELSAETLRAIERSEREIEEGDVWTHEEIKQRLDMDDE
jgi:Arc/MetJ-type ribon-helix-helix transcriptional regulator